MSDKLTLHHGTTVDLEPPREAIEASTQYDCLHSSLDTIGKFSFCSDGRRVAALCNSKHVLLVHFLEEGSNLVAKQPSRFLRLTDLQPLILPHLAADIHNV